MITDNLQQFIKQKLEKLQNQHIDVSTLELDHFGYQTSSKEDYEIKTNEATDLATMRSENMVSGRRVGIFILNEPYIYDKYTILGFELVEPREGQICNSQLDHLEFVLKDSFEHFINKYHTVNWDTSALNRPEFAKLTLKFEDGTSIKFHLKNIFEEIPGVKL